MRLRWVLFLLIPALSALPGCEGCGGCSVSDNFPASEKDGLSFCRFGPKTKVVHSVVDSGREGSCSGLAKVQSLTYHCADPTEVDLVMARLYQVVEDDARAECDKFCKGRGSDCRGLLLGRGTCGLKTDSDDARAAGARYRCPSGCEGNSFFFCSLYDAGFQLEDPDLIAKQLPNCRCSNEAP